MNLFWLRVGGVESYEYGVKMNEWWVVNHGKKWKKEAQTNNQPTKKKDGEYNLETSRKEWMLRLGDSWSLEQLSESASCNIEKCLRPTLQSFF